jgi:ribosomal protein S18 acetylase RimI-like enzyme
MNGQPSIRIERAGHAHADEAASIVREYMLATEIERGATPANAPALPPFLQAECERIARGDLSTDAVFLAFRDSELAGCVTVKVFGTDAEIARLYVRDPYRRSGIGRRLMEHAEAHAVELEATRLILDVLPSRSAVIEWYKRLGFTQITPPSELPMPMVYLAKSTATRGPSDKAATG